MISTSLSLELTGLEASVSSCPCDFAAGRARGPRRPWGVSASCRTTSWGPKRGWQEQVEKPVLDLLLGLVDDLQTRSELLLQDDRGFDQVADQALGRHGRRNRPRCICGLGLDEGHALHSAASRRVISVLPTPVGPISMMFLWRDLLTQFVGELSGAASGYAQRDGNGSLLHRPGPRCRGPARPRSAGASTRVHALEVLAR